MLAVAATPVLRGSRRDRAEAGKSAPALSTSRHTACRACLDQRIHHAISAAMATIGIMIETARANGTAPNRATLVRDGRHPRAARRIAGVARADGGRLRRALPED